MGSPGRPRKPRGQVRGKRVGFAVNPNEVRRIRKAAGIANVEAGPKARDLLLQWADRVIARAP